MRARSLQRVLIGVILVALLGVWTLGQDGSDGDGEAVGVMPTPHQPDGLWVKLELPDGRSSYQVGDHLRLSFTINQAAHVYVFNIPPSGDVINIFPNEFTGMGNPLQPQEPPSEYVLPDNDSYDLTVTETGGVGREFFGAIASTEPLPMFKAKDKVLGAILSDNPDAFQSETAAAVQGVEPKPDEDTLKKFNIAVISIQTSRKDGPPPEQATLRVKSTPPARLLVDGRNKGYTLADEFRNLPVALGQHQVELRRDGYQTYRKTLSLSQGKERLLDVTLNRLPIPHFRFSPQKPALGDAVHFSAVESEDLDGTVEDYEWDFQNDGQIDASGYMAVSRYRQRGKQTVKLIVTDNDGAQNVLTETINVQ